MTDTTAAASAASAAATVAAATAASAASIGQTIDADIAAVKARIATLEAAAVTDWAKIKAYFAANHVAFGSLAGVVTLILDKIGYIKL
jgi:activator of HSP90 ATPase